MENPIKAIENIPGEVRNWVSHELQRVEIQAKIDALKLMDYCGQTAAAAAHSAIQAQIDGLKNQLDNLF
jgi:hypothetical protein